MNITNELEYKRSFAESDALIAKMDDNAQLQFQVKAIAEAIQAYE